ncbi:MAG: Na(+)/H(+) antiporter subunit C [Antricoccus sp.]
MTWADSAVQTAQPNVVLIIVCAVLVATGVFLLLERSLTRVLLGVVLAGNGVLALFLIVGGKAGKAPLVGVNNPDQMSDPLPQAMMLTAIVITLATVAFVLAMAYRQWQLTGSDDVQDDVEDRRLQRLAREDATSETFDNSAVRTIDSDELAVDEVQAANSDLYLGGDSIAEQIGDAMPASSPDDVTRFDR